MRAFFATRLQPLQTRWEAYSRREQLTWSAVALLAVIVLVWLYVWQPLTDRHALAQADLQRAEENLDWMQQVAPRVRAATAGGDQSTAVDSPQSMTNAISQAAQQHDLTLTRFEQSGDDGLRFWLDDQPFSGIMAWVATLELQGMSIEQMTISQGNESGMVNVRGVYTR